MISAVLTECFEGEGSGEDPFLKQWSIAVSPF